jgi:hypothetical protein
MSENDSMWERFGPVRKLTLPGWTAEVNSTAHVHHWAVWEGSYQTANASGEVETSPQEAMSAAEDYLCAQGALK